jgi:hypothetical protein
MVSHVKIQVDFSMTTLSNFERLSLALLANPSVGDDYFVDPKLVGELVTSGQEWALRWEYGWLHDEGHPLDAVVTETTEIFQMYRHLQNSADELGLDDELTHFPGFDFNNDPHAGVAEAMVNKIHRFENVRGATDNSHSIASVKRYNRMLAAYRPILASMGHPAGFRLLSTAEIEAILGS